ncbi:hypothetical protein A2U01_0088753, partial [Trifolium medium]|nr:hypothetical protein [Trifolium medium]
MVGIVRSLMEDLKIFSPLLE